MKVLIMGMVCVAVTVTVLFAFPASAQASPSVTLDGKMYIYATDYNTVVSTHYADLAQIPWTSGTAGAVNKTFFNTVNNVVGDTLAYGYANFDIYNHNPYLIVDDNGGTRSRTIWKVDPTTGVGTKVYVGSLGYQMNMGINRTNGDIYLASVGDKTGFLLHDANGNGNYGDSGEKTQLTGLAAADFTGTTYHQDAQFYNGKLYFAAASTRTPNNWISWLSADHTDNNGVALALTSWRGWPEGASDPWTNGPIFFAVGDPNKNGHADIYAMSGAMGVSMLYYRLGHWEDLNNDGVFSQSECIDNISLATSARDIELVTDGTHSMLVYVTSGFAVNYVNLYDNGLIDQRVGGTGTLIASTGLTANDTSDIYLKMDQTPAAVPEPTTLMLLGSGALGAVGFLRRRRMK